MTHGAPTRGPALQAPTTWTVHQADVVRYAGAARDFNAIHYDAGAAREFGFTRPVAHGMLTLGRVLTQVADHAGVERLRSTITRFSGPAYVGAELSFTFEQEADGALCARVADDEARQVLTTTVHLGESRGDEPGDPEGELVADRWLTVEHGPATRRDARGPLSRVPAPGRRTPGGPPVRPGAADVRLRAPGLGFLSRAARQRARHRSRRRA